MILYLGCLFLGGHFSGRGDQEDAVCKAFGFGFRGPGLGILKASEGTRVDLHVIRLTATSCDGKHNPRACITRRVMGMGV